MAFEYELPDVGEGVAEGEIVAWHVTVGDHVDEDEVLADVETDKAIVDLPSPVAGTITELHAEEGEVVDVGSVVVTIEPDEEDETAGDDRSAEAADNETAAEQETAADESEDAEETAVPSGRVFAPPNVRRLARELGVDITAVDGSGPSGRITEDDVRAAAESEEESEPERKSAVSKRSDSEEGTERKSAVSKRSDSKERKSAVSKRSDSETKSAVSKRSQETESDTQTAEPAARERTAAVPATRKLAREKGVDIDEVPTEKSRDGDPFVEPEDIETYLQAQEAGETAVEADADTATDATTGETARQPVSREPYRGIRRTIGEQMQRSASTIPHATHHDTAVVPELVETRAELKERAAERGVDLTYLPFLLKAVVAGLKAHPVMNTELAEDDEEIIYKEYYNIGIAVATDAGLMVPVVEDVDNKGLVELAREIADLVDRARSREIDREEMQGGTFTVTNFGAIGGEYATPIINKPETGILGIGELTERPVVEDGEVVARHTLPVSLSIDHRVIDGAEAAQFTNTVIEYLENPSLLLLE